MRLAVALVASASAIDVILPDDILSRWSNASLMIASVADKDCSGEIDEAFQSAKALYGEAGITESFVSALDNIMYVAGDIDEAATFRRDFASLITQITDFYQDSLEKTQSLSNMTNLESVGSTESLETVDNHTSSGDDNNTTSADNKTETSDIAMSGAISGVISALTMTAVFFSISL